MTKLTCDIVVIGAGAAGLAAARTAAKGGARVLILEARRRVGGRVHTIRTKSSPRPIELGAEFIHGRPESFWKLLDAAKLQAFDASERFDAPRIGRAAEDEKFWEHVEEVSNRLTNLSNDPKKDMNWADFVRQFCSDLPSEAVRAATEYVEGFNATDQYKVSALSLKLAAEAAERAGVDIDAAYRHAGGYDELIEHMKRSALRAGKVSLRLGVALKKIQWSRGRVELTTSTRSRIIARCAIITLPVGVLRASPRDRGGVEFVSPLPEGHARAIASLRSGNVIRIVFEFKSRFWEEIGHDKLSFIHDANADFPTAWTAMPMRAPLLVCWAAGRAAGSLEEVDTDVQIDRAKKSLMRMLKISRRKLEDQIVAAHIADWSKDPYARGAYSYVAVGGAGAADALSKPIGKELIFAGEACHESMSGTVAGAYESGVKAGEWAARTIRR